MKSNMVIRPQIATSNDGKALATNIADLFFSFPYDRLPSNNSITTLLLRPEVCFGLCIAYYTTKPLLKKLVQVLGINPQSTLFKYSVALHNFLLAVFSAICFVNSWPIVLEHFWLHGWEAVYCDQNGTLWNESGLGGWIIIFYWSKYWEFVDTWVLIFKGKKPSFLQVYHHIGIVLFMWGGVLSQSAWLLIVLLLNSGIHTLMYTYFFIKTLYPTVEIKAAKNLTQAQIIQFFVGILYTVPLHFLGESCDSRASRFSVACIQIYAVGLIVLFAAFASKKYKKK